MGIIALQIAVLDVQGGLDRKFSTLTLGQAAGGSLQFMPDQWTIDGTMPIGSMVLAYVFFDERCGWEFDRWDIRTTNITKGTVVDTTSQLNPYNLMFPTSGYDDGNLVYVHFRARGTYNGTGKLMRSAVDQHKLIRIGDKLAIDN